MTYRWKNENENLRTQTRRCAHSDLCRILIDANDGISSQTRNLPIASIISATRHTRILSLRHVSGKKLPPEWSHPSCERNLKLPNGFRY